MLVELGILENWFKEYLGGKTKGYEFNAHSLFTSFYNFQPALKPYQILLHSIEEGIRFY